MHPARISVARSGLKQPKETLQSASLLSQPALHICSSCTSIVTAIPGPPVPLVRSQVPAACCLLLAIEELMRASSLHKFALPWSCSS